MDMPVTLEEAERYFDKVAISQPADGADASSAQVVASKNAAQSARLRAVRDLALGAGVKVGLAWQLRNIERAVTSTARDLDTIYNFAPLMIQQRVVPPVVTEARDLYNQSGETAVRLSGALYRIERQARFASVAPNWREYLTFPVPRTGDALNGALAPRTPEEQEIWRAAVRNGWTQGVEQANLMLTQSLDRLNRDYGGMARFHRFVAQGKVSLPAIASETMTVTKHGDAMAIDETLLRLTTLPDFNSNLAQWRAHALSAQEPIVGGAAPATSTPAGPNDQARGSRP